VERLGEEFDERCERVHTERQTVGAVNAPRHKHAPNKHRDPREVDESPRGGGGGARCAQNGETAALPAHKQHGRAPQVEVNVDFGERCRREVSEDGLVQEEGC